MCVQGIEVEAIWKPLSFSIHWSDAVLQATSSQGRKKVSGGTKTADVNALLIIGVPVFQQKIWE